MGACRDDGVMGRSVADPLEDGTLDSLPAIGVCLLGLIHDFKKDERGVGCFQVRGECLPERSEALHVFRPMKE